jgi:hypothetical protein
VSPTKKNIWLYAIAVAALLFAVGWQLNQLPHSWAPVVQKPVQLSAWVSSAFAVLTFFPVRTGKDLNRRIDECKAACFRIVQTWRESQPMNADDPAIRLQAEDLAGKLGSGALESVYQRLPAALFPRAFDSFRIASIDWHLNDVALAYAETHKEWADIIEGQLRPHGIRVFADFKRPSPQEMKSFSRMHFFSASRICIYLISGDFIEDARCLDALEAGREKYQTLKELERVSKGSGLRPGDIVQCLIPVAVDKQASNWMKKRPLLSDFPADPYFARETAIENVVRRVHDLLGTGRTQISKQAKLREYRVALSYPSTIRSRVREIYEELSKLLPVESIFFDEQDTVEIYSGHAVVNLRSLFSKRCELAVALIADGYNKSAWCAQVEYESMLSILLDSRNALFFISIDGSKGPIDDPGLVPKIMAGKTAREIAQVVFERLNSSVKN